MSSSPPTQVEECSVVAQDTPIATATGPEQLRPVPDPAVSRIINDTGMQKTDIADVVKQAIGVNKYAIDRCTVMSVVVPEPKIGEAPTKSVSATIQAPITLESTSVEQFDFRKFNVLIATQNVTKGHVITLCKPWFVASASSMLSIGDGNGHNAIGGDRFEGYLIPSKTMPTSMYVGPSNERKSISDRRKFSYEAMRITAKDYPTETGVGDFIAETIGTLCNGWLHFCPEKPAFPSAPVRECMIKEDASYYGYLANAGTVCYPIQTLLDKMMRDVYDVARGGLIGEWNEDQIDRFVFRYICITSSAVNAHKDVKMFAVPAIVASRDIKSGEVICVHEAPTTALWHFMIGNSVPANVVAALVVKLLRRVSVEGYWDDVRQRLITEESSLATSSASD